MKKACRKAGVLLALCAGASVASPPETVRFLAFGDAGSGGGAQYAVATAMADVCAARGCDFAVVLGDNFYPDGVHSARDLQFETKFEEPYEALKIPFFVVLGNHDNGEDGAHNRYGDYQVEYAQRDDRVSDRFRMPARYYQFSAPLQGAAAYIDFFAIDSTPLTRYAGDPDPKWSPEVYGVAQLRWLQEALHDSKAAWKIALAHQPYAPDSPRWKEFVERSVCAAGVDLMLQGHDHHLEWSKQFRSCGRTEFVTSGAGGAHLTAPPAGGPPAHWQKGDRYGFFWFEVSRERLTGVAFGLDEAAELPLDAGGKPKVAFQRTLERKR